MYFYLIAPLGLKSPALTYACEYECATGDICAITINNKSYKGVVLNPTQKPTFKCKITSKITESFLPYQHILASFIAQYYCVGLGESYGLFLPQEVSEINLESLRVEIPNALSKAQSDALSFCLTHKNPLLFGDTGSGKTEIYIHLIAHTLSLAQNALFLMPEIALTPQIESRLKAVFGDCVAYGILKSLQKQKSRF